MYVSCILPIYVLWINFNMLVSRHWLEKFFDTELPPADNLAEALTFHAFEIDGIQKSGDDDVLDVKVTPNRGHDALSHRGIAKELSAILKLPLAHDPLDDVPALAPITPAVSITLEDAILCPRYIAGYIRGVKVGPSPDWLKRNLEAIGQRSINNIVDATNFVMFNTGQPLHAFDAGKLKEADGKYHIVVRKARAGEKMLALDAKEYTLADSMLVIADGNKDEAIGIAGVKGGAPAGIVDATVDIIIESANFNGVSVRKTAQALKLRTDASSRFEQGLSPELAGFGMRSVVDLVLKLSGGVLEGFADVYPTPQASSQVSVSLMQINEVLGTALTGAEVADIFVRLGFGYKEEHGDFAVMVPFERLDLVISQDLIEEVGRLIGYDKVPATPLSPFPKPVEINKNFYTAEKVREDLAVKGVSEVFTSIFTDKGERVVLNKVDGVKPYLRANLVDGLSEALKKNIPNKDLLGLTEVKLFEIGSVWKDDKETLMVGTVSEKEKALEKPLAEYAEGVALQYQDLPLSNALRYQSFSKYPYIVRDIALWVPAGTEADEVLKIIELEAGNLCVRKELFDRFEKAERVSLAFRLIFQSFKRTLTEEEVHTIMEKISASLKAKGFEIR